MELGIQCRYRSNQKCFDSGWLATGHWRLLGLANVAHRGCSWCFGARRQGRIAFSGRTRDLEHQLRPAPGTGHSMYLQAVAATWRSREWTRDATCRICELLPIGLWGPRDGLPVVVYGYEHQPASFSHYTASDGMENSTT